VGVLAGTQVIVGVAAIAVRLQMRHATLEPSITESISGNVDAASKIFVRD